MTTISTEVYLKLSTEYSWQQAQFMNAKETGDSANMVAAGYLSTLGASESQVVVAKGTVTLELIDDKQIIEGTVDALKEQRKTVLAEAQQKAMQIDEKIQSLLAIEYTGA